MGFATKSQQNITQTPTQQPISENQLTIQELALILEMIKKTTFLGEHVETVYNTVIKLQNQILEQQK